MWMTDNTHEYNPITIKEKNMLFLNRAHALLIDDNYEKMYTLLDKCSSKSLDRYIEIGIALDTLELLKIDPNYSDAANMAAILISNEVNRERISPVAGCVTRDVINDFTPADFDISDYISDRHFFKNGKSKDKNAELDALYQEQLVEDYKRAVYKSRAERLMSEEDKKRFSDMLDENYGICLNRNIELDIMFNLLEALNYGVDNYLAASICATDINREVYLNRINKEDVEFIGMLINEFAPEVLEQGYVIAPIPQSKNEVSKQFIKQEKK